MLISSSWQYAARIMFHLARLDPESRVDARALAGAAGLPVAFTGKLVSQLATAGLVDARRGPRGGLRLARSVREIHLREVVAAVGADATLDRCALGLPVCSDDQPCVMHSAWSQLQRQLEDVLDRPLAAWLEKTSEVAVDRVFQPRINDELL